jgi:predicted Zn-dependent protease
MTQPRNEVNHNRDTRKTVTGDEDFRPKQSLSQISEVRVDSRTNPPPVRDWRKSNGSNQIMSAFLIKPENCWERKAGVTLLAQLQTLYDRHRYLDAYRRSADFWHPATNKQKLTTDELIFAGRLAGQLGGWRLSRWLLQTARQRDPQNPCVRYFCTNIRRKHTTALEDLLEFESRPDLETDDQTLRAWWYASQAGVWAAFRDFERAYNCIERAHALAPEDGWIWSCESQVHGRADRWEDALNAAERASVLDRGSPHSHHALGNSLLHLGRVEEAAYLLAEEAENTQSCATASYASWMQTALAETLEGEERRGAVRRGGVLLEKANELAPLADREMKTQLAAQHLDIAELSDDYEAMEKWATEIRSPFHRRVLENLRKHKSGTRIRLPFRPAIQKHDACLPTSVATTLSVMEVNIHPDEMASELTFGGTTDAAAANWLRERGLVVRFFTVTPEIAARLIQHHIAFVLTLLGESDAHAVAAVGLDEAAGTLIVHDPRSFRTTSYLVDWIGRGEAPLGPMGMAIVPPEKAELLDSLLPNDAEVIEGGLLCQDELNRKGPSAARSIVNDLEKRFLQHPGTRLLTSIVAQEEGKTREARFELQKLLAEFPTSAIVRRRFIDVCRASGNTAMMRSTLESIVDAGVMPGIQSGQRWLYPPSCYVAEYADLLSDSAATKRRAQTMLYVTVRRDPGYAPAWHVLANLLWTDRQYERALLCYRIAACLEESDDRFASSYCAALAWLHREQEGLNWLEARTRKFGNTLHAVGTWTTWISALENFGYPERAIAACQEAVQQRSADNEMLLFAVAFLARMGHWDESKQHLAKLDRSSNPKAWHAAAFQYFRLLGDLDETVTHGMACVRESPRAMRARYELLGVIELRDGARAASEQAARWVKERPAHEELENVYCEQLSRQGLLRWKAYSILLRRLRRNPDDGWAWRELASHCIAQYAAADGTHRRKLERRVEKIIAECDRIAPENPATLRIHALWFKTRGDWVKAVDGFLAAIEREPGNFYSYREAWDCCASFDVEQRDAIWAKMRSHLQNLPGHLNMAREMTSLLAQRLCIEEVEKVVAEWRASRPDDPEVLEAAVDLLLENGHGRPDAERALTLLEPAVRRFPYHLGLRLSLANSYLKTGRKSDAEAVYKEVKRRHPEHPGAHLQLAWIRPGQGKVDEALSLLQAARSHSPRQSELWAAETRILISQGRQREAFALIEEGLQFMPENVAWRVQAINLYLEEGENDKAVAAARGGVAVYPRGAYLWFLLAETLVRTRKFANEGEAESAARRSLSLNASFFASADLLVCLLAEQRRFEEATRILRSIEPTMADPSPARGRLAWLKRMQASMPDGVVSSNYQPMEEAIEDMAELLRLAPWYQFGWSQLMEWLTADENWERTRAMLGTIPAVLRSEVSFRKQRLSLLEKAGLPANELDAEWQTLLCDFPEHVPLYLQRIDALRAADRNSECAELLRTIQAAEPDNPYIQARLAGIELWEHKTREALETALKVWFALHEESPWPAGEVLAAFAQAGRTSELCSGALSRIKQGDRPTLRATRLLAEQILRRGEIQKLAKQPYLRRWFPKLEARELLELVETIDQFPWSNEGHRAVLLGTLDDYGYQYLVIGYFQKHPEQVQADFGTWAQVGRAFLNRKRRKEVRELMADWRERSEVKMWAITNYILASPGRNRSDLERVATTCRDALTMLPHDHCARFLAHKQAEAYALLGDEKSFLNTWNSYRHYFGSDPTKGEFFKNMHLLADVPAMAHTLQQGDTLAYRKLLRELRWRRATGASYPDIPWWAILLFLLSLLQIVRGIMDSQ